VTRWLDEHEQASWRAYITMVALLDERLGHELQAAHGLSLHDYEIMVRLSEAEGRSIRMSDLAERTQASRSRVTHQVDRLERVGYIRRERCATDNRGRLAVLTDKGMSALIEAAPTHVEGVRTHLVDQLTPEQFEELGALSTAVVAHLTQLKAGDD